MHREMMKERRRLHQCHCQHKSLFLTYMNLSLTYSYTKTSLRILLYLIVPFCLWEMQYLLAKWRMEMSEQIGGANTRPDLTTKLRIRNFGHGSVARMWVDGHILGADHSLALYHPFIQLVSRFILWIWRYLCWFSS